MRLLMPLYRHVSAACLSARMCVCVCACMCPCAHAHVSVCVHARVRAPLCVCVSVWACRASVRVFGSVCARVRASLCVSLHACGGVGSPMGTGGIYSSARGRPTRAARCVGAIGRFACVHAGATWTSRTTSAPWAARYSHTTVVDAAGAIYVIGGGDASTNYRDVWASTDGGADRTRAGCSGSTGWVGKGTKG